MSNQQLNCQSCNSLRINAETLCELFRAVQSLQTIFTSIQPLISGLRPLMNSIQQFSSDSTPTFVDDDDGIQSDSEDDGTVELGAEDDRSYHSTDRSASTMLCCPHPTCAKKPRTYAQNSSLVRHFGEHIDCKEKCLLCGTPSTTIRTWLNHYEKCNKKSGNTKLSDVMSRKQHIVRIRKQELNKAACQSKIKAGNKVEDRNGSGKRKAESTGSLPQRRGFGVGSIELNSNTIYRAVQMESKDTPFDESSSWNGHADQFPFTNSQMPDNPIANNEVIPQGMQWPTGQWPQRAGIFYGHTVDWGNGQPIVPYAGEQTGLVFEGASLPQNQPLSASGTGLLG